MNEYVELLRKAMEIPSVTENADEVNKVEDLFAEFLKARGVFCTIEQCGKRKVLYASTVQSKTPDYLLNAHLDVVPAPAEMFCYAEKDGIVHGRGCSDCKGNAVLMAKVLCDNVGKASIGAIFTANEEGSGSTTADMVKLGYSAKKLIIIIDSAAYAISYGQKGVITACITARGTSGHSSEPWAFDNPIDKLVDGYAKLRESWPALPDDKWGDSLAATIVSGGDAANQIPAAASMVVNIRFVNQGSDAAVVERIRNATGCDVEVLSVCQPFLSDPAAPALKALKDVMARHFKGREIRMNRMHGATDARHFATLGVPIAILGLEGGGAHSKDEWLRIGSIFEYSDMLNEFVRG